MITVTSTTEEKVTVVLSPTTAAGNPAVVDGIPTYEVLEGDVILQPSEDGLSCDIISGSPDTINQIAVKADADLGEGVRELTETIVYTVTAPEAASLGVNVSVSAK
jgi:hypothetical protein